MREFVVCLRLSSMRSEFQAWDDVPFWARQRFRDSDGQHRSGIMGNVSGVGETEYWLSVLGIRESLAQSDEDIAAGRTYGEAEVRALLVDMRADLAAADADYASGNTVSGRELRRRHGLS
jgi:hypothetical protein